MPKDLLTVDVSVVYTHRRDIQIGSFDPHVLQLLLGPKDRRAFVFTALLRNDPTRVGKVSVRDKSGRSGFHFPTLTGLHGDSPHVFFLFFKPQIGLSDQTGFAALYDSARPDERPALAALVDVNAVGILHRAAMNRVQFPAENELSVTLNAGRIRLIVQC